MAIYSRPSIQNTYCRRLWIRKKNALLNLLNNQSDIDKMYLYAKYPYEATYQYLVNKRKKVVLNHFADPKSFMEYSNNVQDVYQKH